MHGPAVADRGGTPPPPQRLLFVLFACQYMKIPRTWTLPPPPPPPLEEFRPRTPPPPRRIPRSAPDGVYGCSNRGSTFVNWKGNGKILGIQGGNESV